MENYWDQSVDIYCERLSAAFWAEPINALSNIFFLMAAFSSYRLWRKSAYANLLYGWDMLTLIALMTIIGIGSFLFHTIATRWAGLADVLPIALFIHFGFGVFLYRVAKAGLLWSMLGVFIFGLAGFGLQKIIPAEFVNRSVQYIPAATLLLGLSIWCYVKRVPSAKYFLRACLIFGISLTLRSLDMAICEQLPIGIHYMWHFLNSLVLFYVFKGIISYSHLSVKV
jgi:hypothetical protein